MRFLLRLFLVLFVLLLLAAGAAYLFRREAVAWLAERELRAAGLGDLQFTVEEVGLDRVDLVEIARGDTGDFSAVRVTVHYEIGKLVSGEVDQIVVEGLRLRLDLTGTGPPVPAFPFESEEGEEGESSDAPLSLPSLPPIALRDVQIVAETLIGPTEVALDGDVLPDGVGGLGAVFELIGNSDLGSLGGSLSLTYDPGGMVAGSAVLTEGRLDLPGGSIGGLGGDVDFKFGGEEEPRLRGQLALSGIEVPRQLIDTADLNFALEAGKFSVDGRLRSPDRKAEAKVEFTAESVLADPIVAGDVALKLEAGSALWPLLGIEGPSEGRALLRVAGDGTLLPIDSISPQSGGVIGWLAAGNTRGRLDLDIVDMSFPDRVSDLDVEYTVDWALTKGLIVAGLPQDARASMGQLSLPWLIELGVPDDTAAALAKGATLELPAAAAANPRFYLQASAEGHLVDLAGTLRLLTPGGMRAAVAAVVTADLSPRLEVLALAVQGLAFQAQEVPADGHLIGSLKIGGDLNGTLEELSGELGVQVGLLRTDLGGYPVQDLAVSGRFTTILTPERVSMTLVDEGTVSIQQVTIVGAPLLPAGSEAVIESGQLDIAWSPGPFRLTHDATAIMDQQRLSFGSPTEAVPLIGDFGRLRLIGTMDENSDYWGTVEITGADLEMPSYGLTMGESDATWVFPQPGEPAPPGIITVGRGAVSTGIGRISGLTLDAEVVEGESDITLTGTGRGPGGVGRMSLRLTDDDATGRGGLTVAWGPATFKPNGLQPKAILPFLSDFNEVEGKAKILLQFSWSNRGAWSEMQVTLTDFSFEHTNATVQGLNGKIVLDGLAQLSTPPGQIITASMIDVGMPLTDVTATLDIEPGRSPTYLISDLAFTLAGGRFRIDSMRYDPRADRIDSTVHVEDLDLALLTQELGISDFAMEGEMSGVMPIGYAPSDETITITSGRLENTTPGAIRYGQPGTAELRAGGDENFALALQALENFQYKTLDITIDKEADGSTRLQIVLEGNNPDVLDGYPFLININLTTNLANVLEALREGYRLNPDLFKGGWTFQ